MKIDRLLAKHHRMGRTAARRALVAGRVRVGGMVIADRLREVDRFEVVHLDDEVVQPGRAVRYLMLHTPAGILSATSDPQHRTVIDLLDDPQREELHLVGRLDRASTGLLLLTNDGRWSKRLMAAEHKVSKVYEVETAGPIAAEAIEAFAQGFYFHTEDITTLPAKLEILGECRARVTLHEGRYHQIKRMFHRVQNRMVALHRVSMGGLVLPGDLPVGAWRALTAEQVQLAMIPFTNG